MPWQLLWHIAVRMASPPEQLDMQELLADPQLASRRRTSAAQVMHSGGVARIAPRIVVEDGCGWGARAVGCRFGPAHAANRHSIATMRTCFIWSPPSKRTSSTRFRREYARCGFPTYSSRFPRMQFV
jgi:hypothetical protein